MRGLNRHFAYDLTDKVVVITGASRGIGLALANAYGQKGAKVALLARDTEALERATDDLGRRGIRAAFFRCDVAVEQDCVDSLGAVRARFARIDVLVNNAGVTLLSPVEAVRPETLTEVMAINVLGPLRLSQNVLKEMRARGDGQIVFLSSVAAMRALPGLGGYAATKAAVSALADALRVELRDTGIDIITISPGKTKTDIVQSARGPGGGARPLEHLQPTMSPEHVAEAVVDASQRRARRRTLGAGAHLIELAQRLSPGLTDRLAARSMEKR